MLTHQRQASYRAPDQQDARQPEQGPGPILATGADCPGIRDRQRTSHRAPSAPPAHDRAFRTTCMRRRRINSGSNREDGEDNAAPPSRIVAGTRNRLGERRTGRRRHGGQGLPSQPRARARLFAPTQTAPGTQARRVRPKNGAGGASRLRPVEKRVRPRGRSDPAGCRDYPGRISKSHGPVTTPRFRSVARIGMLVAGAACADRSSRPPATHRADRLTSSSLFDPPPPPLYPKALPQAPGAIRPGPDMRRSRIRCDPAGAAFDMGAEPPGACGGRNVSVS